MDVITRLIVDLIYKNKHNNYEVFETPQPILIEIVNDGDDLSSAEKHDDNFQNVHQYRKNSIDLATDIINEDSSSSENRPIIDELVGDVGDSIEDQKSDKKPTLRIFDRYRSIPFKSVNDYDEKNPFFVSLRSVVDNCIKPRIKFGSKKFGSSPKSSDEYKISSSPFKIKKLGNYQKMGTLQQNGYVTNKPSNIFKLRGVNIPRVGEDEVKYDGNIPTNAKIVAAKYKIPWQAITPPIEKENKAPFLIQSKEVDNYDNKIEFPKNIRKYGRPKLGFKRPLGLNALVRKNIGDYDNQIDSSINTKRTTDKNDTSEQDFNLGKLKTAPRKQDEAVISRDSIMTDNYSATRDDGANTKEAIDKNNNSKPDFSPPELKLSLRNKYETVEPAKSSSFGPYSDKSALDVKLDKDATNIKNTVNINNDRGQNLNPAEFRNKVGAIEPASTINGYKDRPTVDFKSDDESRISNKTFGMVKEDNFDIPVARMGLSTNDSRFNFRPNFLNISVNVTKDVTNPIVNPVFPYASPKLARGK